MDPYLSSNFLVEIDGIIKASFQEMSGLESTIDVLSYREGGSNVTLKFPGNVQYSNISLSHGVTDTSELYDWHEQWASGDPAAERKGGAILLLDRQGTEKLRWNFREAWPVKWTGPTLNAASMETAIHRFELAHHGIKLAR